ncbi:MAG: NAD(P)H-dependent glycerol-3-phosphate dehydrogenase [bacterium]|nr:NAD(P)H-dependent glycerol-3-phosphate dehydrogenase [bacterium]
MPNNKYNLTILGAGNMGTAMAYVTAKNGHNITIWNYEGDPEPLQQINEFHENKKYLCGTILPNNIVAEPDLILAVKKAQVVFFILPSNFIEAIAERIALHLPKGCILVDASKGLDEKTLRTIPDVIKSHLPKHLKNNVIGISGPAIAIDMIKDGLTMMNVAGKNPKAVQLVKKVMDSKNIRLIATDDIVGVEIAGSFKNVYAIALGICDGIGYPMNTKAALLVTALKEIGQLSKKMGGKIETVYDLAGLGDLIGTSLSTASRNRRFGECLASGADCESALKQTKQIVEGIQACKIMLTLGKKHQLKMLFAQMVYNAVWKGNAKKELEKYLNNIK